MIQKPRVGFVGLGYMGHGMAVNIHRHGFPMIVMAHRKREAVDDLVRRGAREAATLAEVATQSDFVILCVTGSKEVDDIVRGSSGLASAGRPGLVIVDCTTSNPTTLLKLATDYERLGIEFVDAPLGRSPREAWEGQLSTMVGGSAQAFQRVHPVLSAFATTIRHVGPLGSGHRLKLVNNFISLGLGALYSEALVLSQKAGLTIETFDDLVRSSRMHCAFYDTFVGWVLNGDANSHKFALDTALGTFADVAKFAESVKLKSRLSAAVLDVYRNAVATGDGQAMLPELPRSIAKDNEITLTPASDRMKSTERRSKASST